MSLPRIISVVFTLALLLASAPLPSRTLSAQDGSRTFPETGKTVTGKFLQYWDSRGGLAQQGYPISEQIQETSDSDGKIYVVQYFERAVFEYHPENRPPNDVLLQLLGVFLYNQKYPQGAPNRVPNNEPGSRLFTETGQRVGGVFLQYWNTHGGLAQQGYPISDEFTERSELDGKTYKVQYFQRAVFEFHPENRPPFDVLLSQLGTFRYRAKYGMLTRQLSGSGNQPSVPVSLKAGLAILRSVRANEGYYYIDLLDPSGAQLSTIASKTGSADQSDAVNIPADGNYQLRVQAEGGWTVNVMQPKSAYSPPPAVQSWKGFGPQAVMPFSLKAGRATFRAVGSGGKEAFTVTLLDQDGRHINDIAEATGNADISTDLEIRADGVYVIEVIFDGNWTVEVRQ